MADTSDFQFLQQYALKGSEDAFKTLVDRHLNLVYSVAFSRLGNEAAAKDITQVVFAALACRAGKLSEKVVLTGWLFQVTTHACQDLTRAETRRKKWESLAMQERVTNAESDSPESSDLAPIIANALAILGTVDRDAIVLRFLEGCDFRQVAARLGISEGGAKMRVARSLEKLRRLLEARGVTISESALCSAFPLIIHSAPVGLGAAIKVGVTGIGALSESNKVLLKGVLKTMAWTKAKTAITIGAVILLAATTAVVITKRTDVNAPAVTLTNEKLDEYVGRFEVDGHTMDLQKSGNGLAAMDVDGRPGFVAYPVSDGKFVSHDQNSVTELSFTRDGAGRVTLLTLVRDGKKLGDLKRTDVK